jgi:hypothetical protein
MMRWGMGIGMFGMGVFWLLLIALIVWLVVELAKPRHDETRPVVGLGQGGPTAAQGPGAVTPVTPYVEAFLILDRRLATGEIDIATYQQLRAALAQSRGGPQ